jgi:phenylacetate-CoA ligase
MSVPFPLSSVPLAGFPALPGGRASLQLAMQFQLERSQWLSPSELEELQRAQLERVVRHAAETVPYYKDRFAAAGLALPAKIDHAFLRTIPISTRDELQLAGDRLTSLRPPPEHGQVQFSTTSGSTGKPLRFARTAVTHLNWLSFALRDHLWHRRDFHGKHCAIRYALPGSAEAPDGETSPHWGEVVTPLFASGQSARLNSSAAPAEQLEWLRRQAPTYLLSAPSNLLALADHAQHAGCALPKVGQLRTVGEMLPEELRRRLSEAWNAKVVDVYTCEEAGYLALECPAHGGYHVQSENVWLEIVDDAGAPCAPGQAGRVLLTSLNNFATPLIRYEIGDHAEFGQPCRCGRGLPTLSRIHGRSRNRVAMPDGTNRFPRMGEGEIFVGAPDLKVRQYKCVQHTLDDIELIVAADGMATPEQQQGIIRAMQTNLGHPFPVRLTFVDKIPRSPNGKLEIFVSHVRL